MTEDKGIFIRNIYYMLSYAFQVLKQKNYEDIASEEFENIQDLFAVILAKGISQQLKQGLYREYVIRQEDLPAARGRIDMRGTIRNQILRKKALSCEYDELSVDNIFNQILKTTAAILLRDHSVRAKHRADLKKILLFLNEVSMADPSGIRWDMLRYQRNNRNYEMLMNICYFILDGMLLTTDGGPYRMTQFADEHMHRLFERFVLEYYKKHHGYLSEVKAAQVKWDLSPGTEESMICFLPVMQTDIFLRFQEEVLIIDTKYYGHMMQTQYDKATLHSGNLYQIFTYVKNQDKDKMGHVSGMLLYAKTREAVVSDCSYVMGGNRISVKSLDLNQKFDLIAARLDQIVEEHFGRSMDGT